MAQTMPWCNSHDTEERAATCADEFPVAFARLHDDKFGQAAEAQRLASQSPDGWGQIRVRVTGAAWIAPDALKRIGRRRVTSLRLFAHICTRAPVWHTAIRYISRCGSGHLWLAGSGSFHCRSLNPFSSQRHHHISREDTRRSRIVRNLDSDHDGDVSSLGHRWIARESATSDDRRRRGAVLVRFNDRGVPPCEVGDFTVSTVIFNKQTRVSIFANFAGRKHHPPLQRKDAFVDTNNGHALALGGSRRKPAGTLPSAPGRQ